MIIHEMEINGKYLLKISKETVNGTSFGHIRLWERETSSNRLLPTKKGFGFDLKHVDDMINGLILLKCFQSQEKFMS